jgi:hypothetical protein
VTDGRRSPAVVASWYLQTVARRFVLRSALAAAAGSLGAACYWITPYSDLTASDGVDAAARLEADAASLDAGTPSDADPDLLGYWTFEGDEAGVARDRSGLGHDLLLEDAVVGAPGYDGGVGLQYPDGTGLAHSDVLGTTFPPAGTLSVWALFPVPVTDGQRAIFDGYDERRHHLYIRYDQGRGDAAVQPFDFASQIDAGFDFFALPPVPTGRWTHLVMTWDRTTVPKNSARFYVDGDPAAGADFVPDDAPVTQYFELRNGYAGAYDDLALWKRAFSEEEVREIP